MADWMSGPTMPLVPEQEWQPHKAAGRAAAQRKPEIVRRAIAGDRRALSVRRPWANLIIAGHKTVENRSWSTGHRGELVIHGGQAWDPDGVRLAAELGVDDFDNPHQCSGGYLGLVRLVDVHPADGCCAPWGEHGPGIVHWVLADPVAFATPVPGKGRLGLYWIPTGLLGDAR
jgi:ASCH domain